MPCPLLSVIIVAWNTCGLLRGCLQALWAGCGIPGEVVVIDNASVDGSAGMVQQEFPEARLIANAQNVGYAHANNQGIVASRGRYIVLLNSDTLPQEDTFAELIAFMESHPQAAIVGPRLLRPDGAAQPYAFGSDPTPGYLLGRGLSRLLFRRYLHDWASDAIQEVHWVSGACLMARREAVERVGMLDERFFMYFEDNDWCLRMRQAGWQVYYNPRAEIVHLGGRSLARNPQAHSVYYDSLSHFYAEHYGALAQMGLKACLLPYRWLARYRGMP